MGNDMYNDEQLAHAKAHAERGAPATTLDISRRLTDDEIRTIFTSPMVSTTETYEAIALRFEVTRARREEERLRLALETATANVEAFSARAFRAERERDDFVEKLKAAHKREDGYRIERDALLAKAAPPSDAPLDHVAFLTGLPVELNSLLPEGSIFIHPRTFNGLPAEHPSWLDRMRAEAKKVTSALDGDGRDGFNGSGPFEG